MATEIIDIGTLPNDGTGNPLRVAFDKINNNFATLQTGKAEGPDGSIQFNSGNANLFMGDANLVYDAANNTLQVGANIDPIETIDIGTPSNVVGNIYLATSGLTVGNVNFVTSNNTVGLSTGGNTYANLVVNNITVGNTASYTVVANTTTTNANQIIWSMPASDMSFIKINMSTIYPSDRRTQTSVVDIIPDIDHATLRWNAYGQLFVGNAITKYNVQMVYGNACLMVTPLEAGAMTHTMNIEVTK